MRREVAWSELEVEWVSIENLAEDPLSSGRGSRSGLDWSGLVMMSGCSENFTRCPPVLGHGSRWGSCILRFWGMSWGLKGSGVGEEGLAWSEVVAKSGLVEGLARDPLGSGCSPH